MATNATSNLDVSVNGIDNLTPTLNRINSDLIRWVGAVSSALSAAAIIGFPVTAVREFQREMANVQKTTNFTSTEIKYLSQDIAKLSLNVDIGAKDLAKIAAAAGQQGLGREGTAGVLQFTESIARMSSVLDISVEEAGTAMGKLASIFKIPLANIENIVSGFNQVANNSTAAGDQLLDVVKRVGDAAGALNIEQALGIGAASIDFGASAEVAGTSLVKIFADMQSKAQEFSKVMGVSATAWIGIVQNDGIKAFKMYLDKLRTMDDESRQKAIAELSGTGRIGSLLNKFVNDTTNSVLDRTLRDASEGIRTGTSAINEQRTVMETLDAQIKITGNAFKLLGITAGEEFAKPLTGYMVEIKQALSDPSVMGFAQAVGKSFLDLFNTIATGTKWVASLNINWENFIAAGGFLLKLKLVEYFGGLVLRMTPLAAAYKRVTVAANESAAAQAAAASVPDKGILGSIRSLMDIVKARQAVTVAVREQAAAEAAAAAMRDRTNKALLAQDAARTALAQAQNSLKAPTAAVGSANAALSSAENLPAVLAAKEAASKRLEAAEAAHQANLTAMQQQHAAQRKALTANGSRAGLAALQRAQEEEIAALDAAYAKKEARAKGWDTRRIAAAQAAATQEVAVRRAAVAQAEADLLAAQTRAALASRGADVRMAEQDVRRLKERLTETELALAATTGQATLLTAATTRLGAAMRFLGVALNLVFRLLGSLAFWGVLIYSILDAVGGLEILGKGFEKLTDTLGITSAAVRRKAQADKEEADAMKRKIDLIEDTIKKYKEMTAAAGKIEDMDIKSIEVRLKGDDRAAANAALTDFENYINGAVTTVEQRRKDLSLIESKSDAAGKAEEAAQAAYDAAKAKLSKLEPPMQGLFGPVGGGADEFSRMTSQVDELGVKLAKAKKDAAAVGPEAQRLIKADLDRAEADIVKLKPLIASLFSDKSAEILAKWAPQLQAANDEMDKLKKVQGEIEEKRRAAVNETNEDYKKGIEVAAESARIAVAVQQSKINVIRNDVLDLINKMANAPGVSEALKSDLSLIKDFLARSPEAVASLLKALSMTTSGDGATPLKGGGGPGPAKEAGGTDKYGGNTSKAESEARRLARAKLAYAKEQRKQELDLVKAQADEQSAVMDNFYDRGLVSIQTYYRERRRILESEVARAIELARLELKAVQDARTDAMTPSEKKVNDTAQLRINGEIKVLELKMGDGGTIASEIARQVDAAVLEFRNSVRASKFNISDLLAQDSEDDLFQKSLDTYLDGYQVFLSKLEKEAKENPTLKPLYDDIARGIQQIGALEAVGAVFKRNADRTDLGARALDRYIERLGMLRDRGLLTNAEYEEQADKARASQMALLDAEILANEQRLVGLDSSTLEYAKLVDKIEEARIAMQRLGEQGNQTAKDINKGITDNLEEALNNLQFSFDSLKEVARSFVVDTAKEIKGVFAKNVAQSAMSGLSGADGAGGIGGMISGLLRNKGAGRGETPGTPMFVSDVADGVLPGAKALADPIKDMGKTITESWDKVSGTLSTTFDSFLTGAKDTFGPLFMDFGKSIASMFSGSAGSAASSGIGAWFSSMFHGGGRVGSGGGMKRMVHPSAFRNAAYYHEGTAGAGLKPDEVAAVLRKGETVRTEEQEAALRGQLSSKGGGDVNVYVIPPDAQPAMTSNDVIVTLTDNIARKGSAYQLIKTIPRGA